MAIIVQHNNPIAPATGSSADDLMNAYQAHAAAIRGETQADTGLNTSNFNPYKPQADTQQDAQQSHLADMQQFLAPIAMNQYDVDSDHTDEKKQAYHDNLIHDPWFKEHGEDFQNKLDTILNGINNGMISEDEGRQEFASYGAEVVDPSIDKHHGKHSDSHMKNMHDTEHAIYLKKQAGVK